MGKYPLSEVGIDYVFTPTRISVPALLPAYTLEVKAEMHMNRCGGRSHTTWSLTGSGSTLHHSRLVPHHSQRSSRISHAVWLGLIDQAANFSYLGLSQINIPRSEVLLQSLGFGCTWDSDHALGRDPCKGDLGRCTAFFRSQLLHLVHNGKIFVKVLTLEFRDC